MTQTTLLAAVAGATLLAMAANDPARASDSGRMVSTYNKPTTGNPGVYRTSDGGSSWHIVRSAPQTPVPRLSEQIFSGAAGALAAHRL